MKGKTITCVLAFLVVMLCAVSAYAYVQEEWMVRLHDDDTSYSSGNAILIDSSDFIYVVGSISGANGYEMLVVKFDGSGSVVWERVLSGRRTSSIYYPLKAAALDLSDNVVVGGSAGAAGAFILKLDPQGNTLWERTSTASNTYVDIKACSDVGMVAIGSTSVAKYSANGTLLWEKNSNGATFYAVATDPAGNVHISGSSLHMGIATPTLWSYDADGNFRFTAYKDNSNASSYGVIDADEDGNIATVTYAWSNNATDKYDTYGNLLWSIEQSNAFARDMKFDVDGNLLLGGSVYGYHGSYAWPEFSVLKYSPSGDFLWKRSYYSYGDSSVYGINLDADGNVYATGEFGYCPGTFKTMRFNSDGSAMWNFEKYLQFECASINYGFGVAVDSSGNAYAAGHTTYPYSPWRRKLTLIKYAQYCPEKPSVTITSLSPEYIWPPDHKEHNITVTGTVTVPAGCSLKHMKYSVTDEYGDYSSEGPLSIHAYGQFSLSIPLEAWRDGDDLDGRNYSITVSFSDDAGTTSETLNAVVPHDRRK